MFVCYLSLAVVLHELMLAARERGSQDRRYKKPCRRVPLRAVAHVAVGPVGAGELDHQPELVDAADGGEHGDELVLEAVPGDPVAVDLCPTAGRAASPAGRRLVLAPVSNCIRVRSSSISRLGTKTLDDDFSSLERCNSV